MIFLLTLIFSPQVSLASSRSVKEVQEVQKFTLETVYLEIEAFFFPLEKINVVIGGVRANIKTSALFITVGNNSK